MDYIEGTIKSVVFYSEDSQFAIAKIEVSDQSSSATLFDLPGDVKTVKGNIPRPKKGEVYRFFGEHEQHPTYGLQFAFQRYEKIEGASKEGIVEYLSSDLFPGVGEKSAERIVEHLGQDALKKIARDKRVLDDVPKLSAKAKNTLHQNLKNNKANEQTRIRLLEHGLSHRMIEKILKQYEEETIGVLEENPYALIDTIEGIGFERADAIAKNLGFSDNDPKRIRALIVHLFHTITMSRGHTHLHKGRFLEEVYRRLNKEASVEFIEIEEAFEAMQKKGRFLIEGEEVTLKAYVQAEEEIAAKIQTLLQSAFDIDHQKVDKLLKEFQKRENIVYTDEQTNAIKHALSEKVFIVSGGPGTGKTTVIKGLIYVYCGYHNLEKPFYESESDIHLIAPTGRAAKRMNEATGAYASTIHRFLGYTYEGTFHHSKYAQKSGKLFIIDESSMIDTLLASQLFQSLPDDADVVLVGDDAQLPSVGPGQVLRDLLESGIVPGITLRNIHRQARGSKIVELANQVRKGTLPADLDKVYPDRYVFPEKASNFHNRLKSVVDFFLKEGYDLLDDIQVLIPMYRGETGIDATNAFLQETYNQNTGKALKHQGRTFRIDDKVLQLTNQIEDGIMNGDQGVVTGIDNEKGALYATFMEQEVRYEKSDLDNLTHAYAMSIHKSQGSEYKVVVLPLFRAHTIMLKRKLIYTAITRAEEALVVLGDVELMLGAVRDLEEARQTKLAEKLKQNVSDRAAQIDAVLQSLDESETITPYDFEDGKTPSSLPDATPEKSPYDFLKGS